MSKKDPNQDLKDQLNEIDKDINNTLERKELKKRIKKAKFDKKLIKLGLKKTKSYGK